MHPIISHIVASSINEISITPTIMYTICQAIAKFATVYLYIAYMCIEIQLATSTINDRLRHVHSIFNTHGITHCVPIRIYYANVVIFVVWWWIWPKIYEGSLSGAAVTQRHRPEALCYVGWLCSSSIVKEFPHNSFTTVGTLEVLIIIRLQCPRYRLVACHGIFKDTALHLTLFVLHLFQ